MNSVSVAMTIKFKGIVLVANEVCTQPQRGSYICFMRCHRQHSEWQIARQIGRALKLNICRLSVALTVTNLDISFLNWNLTQYYFTYYLFLFVSSENKKFVTWLLFYLNKSGLSFANCPQLDKLVLQVKSGLFMKWYEYHFMSSVYVCQVFLKSQFFCMNTIFIVF